MTLSRFHELVLEEFGEQFSATVSVSKINPPIGGDVEMVTIKMSQKRKK